MQQKESIRSLKQEVEDARATIEAQEQRLQKMQGIAQGRKEGEGKLPKSPSWGAFTGDKGQLPRPASAEGYMRGRKHPIARPVELFSPTPSRSPSRSPSPTFSQSGGSFGGRWTAYRADVRKVKYSTDFQVEENVHVIIDATFLCNATYMYIVT